MEKKSYSAPAISIVTCQEPLLTITSNVGDQVQLSPRRRRRYRQDDWDEEEGFEETE